MSSIAQIIFIKTLVGREFSSPRRQHMQLSTVTEERHKIDHMADCNCCAQYWMKKYEIFAS